MLYNEKIQLLNYDFIFINNPNVKRATRDILYAKLKIRDNIVNVFVNHWPSRWGGQEESNYKRVFAAKILRNYINVNIAKDEVQDDASKVKNKTKEIIKKGKEKIN